MSDVNASNFGVLAASARGGDQESIDRLIAAGCQGPDNKWRLPVAATPSAVAPASTITAPTPKETTPVGEAAPLKGDSTAAVDSFLKPWCAATLSYPVLTAIFVDPKTGEKGRIETQAFPKGPTGEVDWRAVFSWVDARNGKANLYFLVNPLRDPKNNKASRTDIAALTGLHVDVDVRVGEDQAIGIKRIVDTFHAYKVKPSCIIASGGGAQAFWLLDPPLELDGTKEAAEDAKLCNLQIERDLAGDSCHNIDRIMRLPGTLNLPDKVKRAKGRAPALAYVVEFDPTRRYPLASFDKADPDDKPKQAATESRQVKRAMARGDAKESGPRAKGQSDTFYEGVPVVPDDTPILTIDDSRLMFMDRVVKSIIINGKPPEEAPDEVKQMTRGTLDMKCVAELVRVGLSDRAIKQVYRLGRISADADQWPRGFDGDMDRLIEKARELKRDPDIDRYNSLYFVIMIGGKVRIAQWVPSEIFEGQFELVFLTVEDFSFFHRREKKVTMVPERDADGQLTGNMKKKSVSMVQYWLNHPQCRQYEGVRFMPTQDKAVVGPYMNLWRGFGCESKPGDWSLFKAHMLDNLCNGNEEHFQYLRHWMGFIVQKRMRTDVILLLRSTEEGTGKSFFAKHFGLIFGPAYMEVHNPEHVVGKFNQHLQSVVLINPDEALFSGDRRHRNALWSLTTSDTITVEPKGLGTYRAKNYLNFILTTNQERAVDVSGTSRRVFSLDVAPHRRVDYKYFDAIEEQLKNGGYEAMLHELQNMDLSTFNVRDCPKTESLKKQVALNRKGVDEFISEICHDGSLPFAHPNDPSFIVTSGADNKTGFDFWLSHDAPAALKQLGAGAVKNELKHKWLCTHTKRRLAAAPKNDEDSRRERDAWRYKYGTDYPTGIQMPPLVELRAAFTKEHGPQTWRMDVAEWGGEPTKPGTQGKLQLRGQS